MKIPIDLKLFADIAQKVLTSPASRTSIQKLGKEFFKSAGRSFVALQQNPNTGSQWARVAQEGAKVVQFKDLASNSYVAASVNGNIVPY